MSVDRVTAMVPTVNGSALPVSVHRAYAYASYGGVRIPGDTRDAMVGHVVRCASWVARYGADTASAMTVLSRDNDRYLVTWEEDGNTIVDSVYCEEVVPD